MVNAILFGVTAALQPNTTDLTIYNGGFALVKEQRSFSLKSGIQEVAVEDVAQMIEANSVAIKSLSAPGSFSVLEQNYQYDLISPLAILNKAVGSEITFTRILPNGQKERLTGRLMSSPTSMVSNENGGQNFTWNGMVIQTIDGKVILNPTGEIEVNSIPNGLISKPTLVWLLEAASAGMQTVELSYLTQGVNWKSDYIVSLDAAGKLADVKGWVTLTNNCGTSFNVKTLKLLAGDVQREQPNMPRGGTFAGAAANRMDTKQFSEESFADYHLYTLGRPTTVKNKEIKQVSLLEGFKVPFTKRLVVDPMKYYTGYRPSEGEVGTGVIKPTIQLQMVNSKANNMGMPLPAGTVKVYQTDSSGSLQLLGEDRIDHTPKDEKVTLTVGRAFDIAVERKRTDFKWYTVNNSRRGMTEMFEVELRNRKETTETVTLIERFWGEFTIMNPSMEPKKLDSNTYEFSVTLKPNEVKKVTFTVETRW